MAISTLRKLDKIVFPAFEISNITNMAWNGAIETMLSRPAGHVSPLFRGSLSQNAQIAFSTRDIGTIIGSVPENGLNLTADTTTYFKLATATGAAARAASSHAKIVVAEGVLFWTTIRLPHNGGGTIDCVLAARYDGTNEPFVYTGSLALSGNLTDALHFGAGPVALNGAAIPGVQEIEIASGARLVEHGGETEQWPTALTIEETAPQITVRTKEAVNWPTVGFDGVALNGSSGLTCYARKFANVGRVADVTAGHLKFVGANGTAIPISTSGDGSSVLVDEFRCDLISPDDSTAPLAMTNGSAIT